MATYSTRLECSFFHRFAGRSYRHKESGRRMRVYGTKRTSEAAFVVLVKKRRAQLIPDEWIPRHWLMWVDGAEEIKAKKNARRKA